MPQIYGKTGRLQPTVLADAAQIQPRFDRTGEQFVIPVGSGTYAPVVEGGYYKATNPTFGTAFAPSVAAATAFSETQASIIVRNTGGASGKDIYLDYIHIWYATAQTAATVLECAMQIDNSNRTGTGGTSVTPVNANNGIATASVASVTVGAITSGAAVSSRKLGYWRLKSAITAAGDEFMFNFGSVDTVVQAPGVAKAIAVGPVLLPANSNHSFLLHLFGASQSAAGTIHMDMGWIER